MSRKVTLEWYEVRMAALVASLRHEESSKQGRRDARGLVASEREKWQINLDGAGAELACAKALDRYWPGSVNVSKALPDVSKKIQVRSTKGASNCLIVEPDAIDEQVYVLVTGSIPDYCVIGWIKAKDAKQMSWLRNPGEGRTSAYFVPQWALTQLQPNP